MIDIEANSLTKPDKIWVIVCKDIDTGQFYIFREITKNESVLSEFIRFSKSVDLWIGHNYLGYDADCLQRLCGLPVDSECSRYVDTLIVSKLYDYSRLGHSIEDYGLEFGLPKGKFVDFSKYSTEMEEYCIRDVEICEKIFRKYEKFIASQQPSILLEHQFQLIVNDLHSNGFYFNSKRATTLLDKVKVELEDLDKQILQAFPPKLKLIREVTPKATKYGTIALNSLPVTLRKSAHELEVGAPFCWCAWQEFNPSSHKQIIDVLNSAGWSPTDKTQTHIETERELNRLKYVPNRDFELDLALKVCHNKIMELRQSGWKINENNLSTLPPSAPSSARLLARRILLESRRRTLTEWLDLVRPEDGRIHGSFYGIGAWTHRMAHQKPNTANIPNEFDINGKKKLLGKEMRALWCAPRNRLLVGVDAEGIQLRIFAHYIDDKEFTEALVNGRKEHKTDPHSLNQRILGPACKSRAAAKRFIYALLLGAGIAKLAQILESSREETEEALNRLIQRYTGFDYLKRNVIPVDAKRGWFEGLDGRRVRIPGDTVGQRKHLCMSGYLQNGEAVIMKKAAVLFYPQLQQATEINPLLVNFVHDEWQTECPNDVTVALEIAKLQADSLRIVGEQLGLKCPLAGSYYNDDLKDWTIGTNWSVTH